MKPKREPKKMEKKLSYSLFPKANTVPLSSMGKKIKPLPFNYRKPYADD